MTMRVLFVQGAAQRAGAERILLALLRNLDHSEVEPYVAFLADGPFVDEVRSAGARVLTYPTVGRARDPRTLGRTVQAITEAIERVRPDVVQATGEKMSVYAGLAARRTGVPSVFWLHDSPSLRRPAAGAIQTAMTLTPHASSVACAEWLAQSFTHRGLKTRAIPNGIELDHLPSHAELASARQHILGEAGWPDDAVVFAYVARLQRWKGPEVFLRAAARVARCRPRARFLVVGGALYGQEETYAASLPQLAASFGLGGRVHFTGYRSDSVALMGACDVTVHCSLRPDPFPTVVIEGMALGNAVIASRVRGPEEMLTPGHTGVLTPRGDDVRLADAMRRMVDDVDLRQEMGAKAATEARRRFDARRMARDFEAHWRGVLSRPGGRCVA